MSMWKSDRDDEFRLLQWIIIAIVVALLVAGLIEWNARRQAAAMTRELLRPATPEEQRQIDAQLKTLEPTPEEIEPMRRRLWTDPVPPRATPRRDTRPLGENERCIERQRFRRVANGWEQVGTC